MANLRSRSGRAAELAVLGEALAAGLDCYLPLVDDQAIDAILRVQGEGQLPRYFDLQIKSSRAWSGIRGAVAALARRPTAILVLVNSSSGDSFWLDARAISRFFPERAHVTKWGDIFLNKATLSILQSSYRLEHIRRRLRF